MSRYSWKEKSGRTCVVGWDNPLQSYFWQVLDAEGEEVDGSPLGMPGQEITSVDDLVACARFMIGPDMQAKLEADKAGASEPTALQRMMRGLMASELRE